MDSESSLYQKVWGEPDNHGRAGDPAQAPGYEPDPADDSALYPTDLPEPLESWTEGDQAGRAGKEILRRIEQVENRISQIERSQADSAQLLENGFGEVTDALKGLEARLTRLEKGVVRSLEYLDARIEALGR